MKKWTKEEHCDLIKKNSTNVYSLMVELGAIYLKFYGELPKGVGLSGQQAEYARSIVDNLPDAESVSLKACCERVKNRSVTQLWSPFLGEKVNYPFGEYIKIDFCPECGERLEPQIKPKKILYLKPGPVPFEVVVDKVDEIIDQINEE